MYMSKKNNKEKDERKVAYTADALVGGGIANVAGERTTSFNSECTKIRSVLNTRRIKEQEALNRKLKIDSNYDMCRKKGVNTAYAYEKHDILTGGSGSTGWNKQQQEELLTKGKVRGYEGHHINNVANHPEQQVNPDNIKFYPDRKTHLNEGHGGDFHNPSSGPLIDKDKMLRDTNRRRVQKNEIIGALTATAFGAVTGVVDSVCKTCREEGWSKASVKKGVKQSAKPAAKNALIATVSYGVGRVVSYAFNKLLKRF